VPNVKSKSTAVKTATKETSTDEKKASVTPKQRYQMIAEAAYFRAEKRGFDEVDVEQDWREAQEEIDMILQ